MDSLNRNARVDGGFASVRSVASMEKEDHMHSFFLAETCKYLFLLANDTFWKVCVVVASLSNRVCFSCTAQNDAL